MDIIKSLFGAGTAAVITVTFIHPFDVVKTRLQVSGDGRKGTRNYKQLGINGTIKVIYTEDCLKAFWKGIQAAWMRESTYTSIRLGLYEPIKHFFGVTGSSPFIMKFMCGSLAGAIGSTVGNPFDVVKTRLMASEGKSPPISQAFSDVYGSFGFTGFYKGLQANVMRAMVLNGTKMSCYDQIKHSLFKYKIVKKKGLWSETLAAFGAGFFMTCTVAPFDKIRTRLMNQPAGSNMYNGFLDCALKIIKNEGIRGLWAGFVPIWARFAPTTTFQLVIFSQLKILLDLKSESSG
jgi:hypothetical protein